MWPVMVLRILGNSLGLAWWARVETSDPFATYWFGPFLTRKNLEKNLKIFLDDLSVEGTKDIQHNLVRCRRGEPLTTKIK